MLCTEHNERHNVDIVLWHSCSHEQEVKTGQQRHFKLKINLKDLDPVKRRANNLVTREQVFFHMCKAGPHRQRQSKAAKATCRSLTLGSGPRASPDEDSGLLQSLYLAQGQLVQGPPVSSRLVAADRCGRSSTTLDPNTAELATARNSPELHSLFSE